jgi:hypothetical protein
LVVVDSACRFAEEAVETVDTAAAGAAEDAVLLVDNSLKLLLVRVYLCK